MLREIHNWYLLQLLPSKISRAPGITPFYLHRKHSKRAIQSYKRERRVYKRKWDKLQKSAEHKKGNSKVAVDFV